MEFVFFYIKFEFKTWKLSFFYAILCDQSSADVVFKYQC